MAFNYGYNNCLVSVVHSPVLAVESSTLILMCLSLCVIKNSYKII